MRPDACVAVSGSQPPLPPAATPACPAVAGRQGRQAGTVQGGAAAQRLQPSWGQPSGPARGRGSGHQHKGPASEPGAPTEHGRGMDQHAEHALQGDGVAGRDAGPSLLQVRQGRLSAPGPVAAQGGSQTVRPQLPCRACSDLADRQGGGGRVAARGRPWRWWQAGVRGRARDSVPGEEPPSAAVLCWPEPWLGYLPGMSHTACAGPPGPGSHGAWLTNSSPPATKRRTCCCAEPGSPQRLVRQVPTRQEQQRHLGHAHHSPCAFCNSCLVRAQLLGCLLRCSVSCVPQQPKLGGNEVRWLVSAQGQTSMLGETLPLCQEGVHGACICMHHGMPLHACKHDQLPACGHSGTAC